MPLSNEQRRGNRAAEVAAEEAQGYFRRRRGGRLPASHVWDPWQNRAVRNPNQTNVADPAGSRRAYASHRPLEPSSLPAATVGQPWRGCRARLTTRARCCTLRSQS